MKAGIIAVVALALGCAAAAGEDPPKLQRPCVPGAQVACACPNGGQGVQACVASGDAYTQCDCFAPPPPGSGGTTGSGGSSAGGGGGEPPPSGGSSAGGAGGTSDGGGGGEPPGGGGSGATGGAGGSGATGSGGVPSYDPVGELAGGISIQELAFYQGVKVSLMKNGQAVTQKNAPIVEGRPALVRVSVAPQSGFQSRKLAALLDLQSSNPAVKPQTLSLDVASASSDGNLGSTFNFALPAEQVTADLKLRVSLHEPSGASVGAVAAGVAFPAQGTLPLGAEHSGAMRITIVPFKYLADGSGRLPDTSSQQIQRYHDVLFAMYPTTKLDLSVRAAVDYQGYVGPGSGWSSWLDKLCDLRMKDQVDSKVYYYGIIAPASSWSSYGSGIAGLGNIPPADGSWGRCSVGLGFTGADTYGFLMAHEVGHTLGRPHAPCGVSGESFPYSGARIGAWGYSLASQKLKDPNEFRDVMSYCDPQWISDYNFAKLFKRIQWVNQNYFTQPEPTRQFHKLLIDVDGSPSWGGSVALDETPAGTPTRVRLLAADGAPLGDAVAHFVPFSEEPAGALFVPDLGAGVAAIAPEGLPAVSLPALPVQ
jgi:hypothetical protein